jgi:hypothetical protein
VFHQGAIKHGRWNGDSAPDLCVMRVPPYTLIYNVNKNGIGMFMQKLKAEKTKVKNVFCTFLNNLMVWRHCWQGRRDRGGVGGVTPPLKTSCRQMKGFVGKQKIIYHKTLSYIRFTVGQYWLRIKKNGKNYVNFVNFRKWVVCQEKFWYVRKIFGPLKWYTDRNFFGDGGGGGGGEVVKNNFLRKNFFVGKFYTHTPPV